MSMHVAENGKTRRALGRGRRRGVAGLQGALTALCALALWVGGASQVEAKPSGPMLFCSAYPDVPACQGQLPQCSLCHTSTSPAAWNGYGLDLLTVLTGNFDESLEEALVEIEGKDPDGDGVSSLDELLMGTLPGDVDSFFEPVPEPSGPANPRFDVGNYDQRFALRRASLTFCGQSPSYDDLKSFDALDDDDARQAAIHELVDGCLTQAFWQEAIERLGDQRIRPVFAVGWDSPIGLSLADYEWDYRLFRYALTGDRDARELLTADYHVEEGPDGSLRKVEGEIARSGGAGPQPLVVERRAGMVSTQWFFVINTMFSALPRTTAAQAYRAYLGMDIAQDQGLIPVAGEPLDVDRKGVQQAECAACHSTLDPLSYTFAYYEGIRGGATGTYRASRPNGIRDWDDPQTFIFGEPVDDLPGWARVAANSDAFARNTAQMLFEHVLQREPGPADLAEFEGLWRGFGQDDGYSANKLLHRLVDTDAFGVP